MCFKPNIPSPPPPPAPPPPIEPIDVGEQESPSARRKKMKQGVSMLQIPLVRDVGAGLGIPQV